MPTAVPPLAILAAALLGACGAGDGGASQADAGPSRPPAPTAGTVTNPLIGVWSRVSGSGCWADQVEFARMQMTIHRPGYTGDLPTVPVTYDLADPKAPRILQTGTAPVTLRWRDPDHLIDSAGCALARAD